MKKIIYFIVAMFMTAIATTAQADEISFTRYVMDTTPAVNVAQAQRCAAAYFHGGTYRHMDTQMTLTCTKHTIRKEWDPKN